MYMSQDLPVLTSLHVLTFLTVLMFVPRHLCPRHLRTYPYYFYIYLVPGTQKTLLLYPNVFVSNTHSYTHIAFSIITLFNTLYSGSCLLCNTIFGSLFYTWRAYRLLVAEHAFLHLWGRNRSCWLQVD